MENVVIEVRAKTVDLAVEAAMQELGITDREQVAVEVVTEPVKGFLGIGGQEAVVRVKPRRKGRNRGNRRKGGRDREDRDRSQNQTSSRNPQQARRDSGRNGGNRNPNPRQRDRGNRPTEKREKTMSDDRPVLPLEEQARIAHEFLEGLIDAYGLEGTVTTRIEEDVIVADVDGDQTEALVGVRGSVRAAIHELTRTVLQRYGQDSARLRLDIAGYAERRRQALSIYARQLIEQLDAEGGEIMLEPMSPADRKVIHDAAAEYPNVTSYSEGEPPRRYVVLSKVSGSGEEEE
ncbi:MAG: RNA-binding cell elongation regulator Jag/EloR [Acidimicrobiia bacterium]